jgi:hypothetical protein
MPRMSMHLKEFLTVLILSGVPYLFWIGQSYALTLPSRSITISTATPSAVASHDFQITFASTDAVGSIEFQYCSNTPLFDVSCTPPGGLSLSGAALTQQTGNTGFNIDTEDSSSSQLVISRPATAANSDPSNYIFTGIINPSVNNQTTYVRISTYSSTDASGNYIDRGAVAFSTSTNFEVGAYVPPFLNFCAGVTVAADCSQTQGANLDLGDLSSQTTSTATSQYAGSTNDESGYSVYVLGTTMTSGNNIITSVIGQPANPGVAEFGINLRKNSKPNVGSEPQGEGTASPSSGYDMPNNYSFVPGSQISNSALPTDYNQMTVSYIVNVPSDQPAGIYSTTLTYLASAQF